ncbi:MAG: hypothetical protein DLM55_11975 [Acidimicrobiales bacterium]|nr:MAG: hypothetical protein DLM55_11975 [Acidimicrobiales bacterium]
MVTSEGAGWHSPTPQARSFRERLPRWVRERNPKWFIGAAIVAVIVVCCCGGLFLGKSFNFDSSNRSSSKPSSHAQQTAPSATTSNSEAPSSTAPSTAAPSDSASPSPQRDHTSANSSARLSVLNVVGKNAAVARDELSRAGFTKIRLTSGDSRYRFVLVPQNWTVQSQSAAPGTSLERDAVLVLTCTKP